MSRYIATSAIRGANALVTEAEVMLNRALAEKGADTPVAFPNTAYYLPTILGMTGKSIEKIGDLKQVMDYTRGLFTSCPRGQALDSLPRRDTRLRHGDPARGRDNRGRTLRLWTSA